MKKFTRDRVVPTISASVSWEIGGTARTGLSCLPYSRQQQERPGQPFLARVEELIDQVLLDPDVPRQHVRDEPIRQRMLLVQEPHHPILVHEQDGAVRRRGRTAHADGLTRQASFAEELARRRASPRRPRAPTFESTESFTPPFWMYSTCSHGSPCVKMTSARRYSTIFRRSRQSRERLWTLKMPVRFDFMARPRPAMIRRRCRMSRRVS